MALQPGAPQRSQQQYTKLNRSELTNHLKTELSKSEAVAPGHKGSDFFRRRLWSWLKHYFKSRFGKKHGYPTYSGGETGVFQLTKTAAAGAEIVIGIVSDWATDTEESFQIAAKLKDHQPDYTIHLGDTYFVGAPHEVQVNFLTPDAPWLRGSSGSFAVLGNHEMYAKGDAFFEGLLPSLGIKNEQGVYGRQQAGFFCLENAHWRILGLDTGYNSTGKPILEWLPFLSPDCHFEDSLMAWLKDVVKLGNPSDTRGIMILTHHQYITAFKNESSFLKPAAQLASLIGTERPILWFWGHEHKLCLFEKVQIGDGIAAYGRCIGHGGMPVELASKDFVRSSSAQGAEKLVLVDTRPRTGTQSYPLGYNGYIIVKIKDANLVVEYYDSEMLLFSESWQAGSDGTLHGTIMPAADCPLTPEAGKAWRDAVA